jgi:serine/threonine protein kinase
MLLLPLASERIGGVMLHFPQRNNSAPHLYAEETDAPLPEMLNPKLRYAYFTTIATGGKSLIQSCRDLYLGRTVCYKTLKPEFRKDAVENIRLLREARISAMLQHPNTMPTYEIGRDNQGHYFFTMKLVHGYTFRELLNYRQRYDFSQLMNVIMQVGNALGYAHSVGVLHRDIKPDNILIGPYGEVLLLDWGLAKVWRSEEAAATQADVPDLDVGVSMTSAGKLQGSVTYMSPEQVDREADIDFRSDIYSLGAVMYEALTGQTPFSGTLVRKVLEDVRHKVPEVPSHFGNLRVPRVLSDLTMSCLSKDPDQRPGSADEVVRTIQHNWTP